MNHPHISLTFKFSISQIHVYVARSLHETRVLPACTNPYFSQRKRLKTDEVMAIIGSDVEAAVWRGGWGTALPPPPPNLSTSLTVLAITSSGFNRFR